MPKPVLVSDFDYHIQDGPNLCGAACAQSFLSTLKTKIPNLTQRLLRSKELEEDGTSWYTNPSYMQKVLWCHLSKVLAAKGLDLILTKTDLSVNPKGKEDLACQIVWSIKSSGWPALIVTNAGDHWQLVKGYNVSQEPTSPNFNPNDIQAFYLSDSKTGNPSNRPTNYIHTAKDCPCTLDKVEDDYVHICSSTVARNSFFKSYLTGGPNLTYTLKTNWIYGIYAVKAIPGVPGGAVSPADCAKLLAAETPAVSPLLAAPLAMGNDNMDKYQARIYPKDLKLIPGNLKKPASEYENSAIEQFRLLEPEMQERFKNADITRIDEVLSVVRIDAQTSTSTDYYNILTYRVVTDKEWVYGLVKVDAFSGEFEESTLLSAGIKNFGVENRKANYAQARNQQPDLPPDLPDPGQPLVWLPCVESPSPFYPFYVVTGKTGVKYFVRLDGKVFEYTTIGYAGG